MSSPQEEEATASFMSVAGCDADFARSFLEANSWNLELAVASLYGDGAQVSGGPGGGLGSGGGDSGGGGASGGGGGGVADAGLGAFGEETSGFGMEDPLAVRAPIAQFNDTLMGDPAQAVPRRAPTNAADHPLEAFRDFRSEGAVSSGQGEGPSSGEVFGMPKRPKNLSEIYRPPTELCFVGSFEELRTAGRQQGRWILVNIQSPTEFASQQLNADTWSDESLHAVIQSRYVRRTTP